MQANDVPHSTIVMPSKASAEPAEYAGDISMDNAVKQVPCDFKTMQPEKVPTKFEDDKFESAAEIEHKDARTVQVSGPEMQVELPKSTADCSGCLVSKDFTGGELEGRKQEEMGIVNEYELKMRMENIKEEKTCAIKNNGKENAEVMKSLMSFEEGEDLVKSSPVIDIKIADNVKPNLNEISFEKSGRVKMKEASNKYCSIRVKQNIGGEEDKVDETEELQLVEKVLDELVEEMDGITEETVEVCEDEQFRGSSEDEKWIGGVDWSMEKQVEEEGVHMDEDEEDEEDEEEDSETEDLAQLRQELYYVREAVQLADERFQQLQGQLEEEQLRSAQQAEEYMKQVQTLQDELSGLTEELLQVRDEGEAEIAAARDELAEVEEGAAHLRLVVAALQEEQQAEIAELQEELCWVRAELTMLRGADGKWNATRDDEKRSRGEIGELQNRNTTTSEGDANLEQQLNGFQEQLTSLELQNKVMSKEKDFLWSETQTLTNCAHELLAEEESLALPNGHLDLQLNEARRHADDTWNDYERWRAALAVCKDRRERSHRECEQLRKELALCRSGLADPPEPNDAQRPWIKRIPMAAIALAVALALLLPRLGHLFT
uniref:sarcolemmal membrane-associated protein-like isoform X1 n=2 Tax=Myxine glutinosa TaxID=7769 RepID=UPI00358DE533